MSETPFDMPHEGSRLMASEIVGRLLLITVHEHIAEFPTVNGVKDPVRVTVEQVDGPEGGKVDVDAMFFQGGLVGKLKGSAGTGRPVLGRIVMGANTKGNAPYLLQSPTEDDIKIAQAYVDGKADEAPAAPVTEPEPASAPTVEELQAALAAANARQANA